MRKGLRVSTKRTEYMIKNYVERARERLSPPLDRRQSPEHTGAVAGTDKPTGRARRARKPKKR